MHVGFSTKSAISRTTLIIAVVVIIAILGIGGYVALVSAPSKVTTVTSTATSTVTATSTATSTATTTATSTTTSTTSTVSPAPTTLTYETTAGPEYLDPAVAYYQQDAYYLENEYENLVMFNKTTAQLIPWLAQNYSV